MQDRLRLATDGKLLLYQNFFKEDVEERLQEQLESELKTIGEKVFSYDSYNLRKIKRMGLTRIHKKFLVQNYFYLIGLAKFNRRVQCNSYNEAFKFLQKSL